ncbi:MAG: zinc-ribbon domain-containing protein [Clostridiaceae bacterium]|nr:zinc-ribbon domain-containing protein [Clostridiaceae bacterium]
MKKCPNCNFENRDEALFCTKCGNKLPEQSLNTEVNETQNTVTPDNSGYTVNQVLKPAVQPSANADISVDTPKKKSKALLFVLGLAAVIAVIFLVTSISFAKPAEKLIQGIIKLSKMDKYTTTTTIDIAYDGDEEAADLLNGLTIKLETAADMNELFAQLTLDLLYSNKPVVQVAAGLNNEDFYVDLKDLHKKKFYQDIEDVIPDYPDYVNDYKIVKKAFKGVSLKFDAKKYMKIINNVLEDNIKKSGKKIILTLDPEIISELFMELLEEAEDDNKLMESVRKNAINIIKQIVKEKKRLKIIDVDDLEEMLEILEDKDEFEEYYQNAISDALSSFDYMVFDVDDIPEMEIIFRLGAGNTIKGIDFSTEINDEIEIFVKSDIKSGASFTKFNRKDSIEISKLMSGRGIEDVVEEITENLIKSIKKNKDLTKKLEDLTGQDIEDSIEMMIYGASRFIR